MFHDHKIIFLLVITITAAAADPYHISINCGGDAHGGRHWLQEGSSIVSTTKGGLITARISGSRFSYSLKLSPGQKILRLHFHPSSYNGFESSNDLFSVEAGNSSLLANFSASVTARALTVNVIVKQFCVTVEENETLNIAFSPDLGNSYAFVNEIEIISIPSTNPLYSDGEVAPNPIIHVDNSTVLERVHYQHIKWGPVSSGDDITSMFGMWSKQPRVGEDAEIGTNKTWRVSVDAGFRFKYLVRLHLCEAGLHMDFVLLINGRVALTSADMLQQGRGNRELFWYNNYVVMDEQLKQGDISISLHSLHEFLDRHGPLEGFEVFKMSSHQSDYVLMQIPDSSLLTLLHSLVYSILFLICCIVFLVYLEHKLSHIKFTREDNKPLSRENQLSNRFSLARILGICGYGGDGKGLVDYGREIVVIKPLKMDSNQRENKFRNVIEALWGLRHVSLIGHCREQQAVADHLYKLARKSNNIFPKSCKQRLQICVEVSQALEYLHTGPMVHRNLKPANILLDDKFVVRLADFGVAKTVSISESQSQDSTKLIGTHGYIAPDFITSGEGTKHSDIYSFGVVVLEVLCGRAGREPRTKVEDVDYDKIDFGNHEEVELEVLMDSSTDSQQQQLPPGFEFYPTDAELVVYAMKRATRNFRSDLVLGEGGFGSVYKRFMNCESDQCFREWQSEVNFVRRVVKLLGYCHDNKQLLLGRLSHLNLLKLFGYRRDDNELLLVYEFKKKGSFENHPCYGQPLLGPTWRKIWIGASQGLQNLHSSDIKVIYRDFKSSKILLDKSYNAKISDFGLATTGPFADKTPVSARIMGTFGYTAPEYITTGHVNVKSDVYGFGVLLLEMLTGLQAIDQRRSGEQQNLVVWMKPRLSDQRKLIHTNSRSTMIGTTRGMHAVEVPVIYRDFKASNILLDDFYLYSVLIYRRIQRLSSNRPSQPRQLQLKNKFNKFNSLSITRHTFQPKLRLTVIGRNRSEMLSLK
ncbi:receptor-like protein kinase FERONIA isoform X2 [Salvia splendens]|uniref:receptor-like protein kinase FERONIA isoform X2 n=1 Tax=Salvia splendens TaxID=180675 RepID=UPI001C2782E2|nr:receptor-like protein kinase FERONIA isoform X2 [Salvia splendens]